MFRQFLSIALTITIFCTQCGWAHISEANFWSERRRRTEAARDPRHAESRCRAETSRHDGDRCRAETSRHDESNGHDGLCFIPASLGTVRSAKIFPGSIPSTSKILIHIQDIHLNEEAQTNIEKIVSFLLEQNQVQLVALKL